MFDKEITKEEIDIEDINELKPQVRNDIIEELLGGLDSEEKKVLINFRCHF